jgi:type IV pilus assembly protein PilE
MMRTNKPKMRGFTLIEMMLTVVIIGVLAAVALPQYQQHVAKGRRVDANSVLSAAALFMQQVLDTNNGAYQVNGAVPQLPVALRTSPPNVSGTAVMYDIAVATPTPNTFILTATPKNGGPMASDACGNLTLDQRGRKGNSGTSMTVQDCWK